MDGDRADLRGLADLAEAHGAFLYVDEAHATGILGPAGAGLCAEPQAKGRIDLVMGTFGKALGGYGAFVACDATVRDWLVNRCRAFIYSTALPPSCAASALRALELLPDLEAERAFVARQAGRIRVGLQRLGLDTLASDTQIIPAVMGSDGDTLAAAQALEKAGILAVAIRPPTVPPGTGRLRLTVTAAHTEAQVDHLLEAFGTLGRLGA
jgi:8-amino-7-oxononanoate synthase